MTFPGPCRRTCPQPLPTYPCPRALAGGGPGGEPGPGQVPSPTRSPPASGSCCPQVAGAEPGAHLEGWGRGAWI